MKECIYCTFKFGGFWSNVKNTDRRRYEGGKQRTVKVDKDAFSFIVLLKETALSFPWLQGCCYELYYYIDGTSPKEYMLVTEGCEWIERLRSCDDYNRAEVIISLQNEQQVEIQDHIVESDHLNSNVVEDGLTELELDNLVPWNGEAASTKTLSVGTRFIDAASFKQFLRSKAILENYGVHIKACNKTRVIATCSHRGCPWRIRASLCADGQTFEVRKFEHLHICPGINRAGNSQATSNWVANEIEEMVRKQPNLTPKQINNSLEMMYGLSLPYMKIWRSRELAREKIYGAVDENYKWVPSFKFELLNRNPVSQITYSCDGEDNSFKRFFVSFKVCIDGFIAGCRYLIGLDACHLKSKYLGVLLSANSLDGNNGVFTIAFAVVETESKKTWQWFLENLEIAFGVEIVPLSFMSDMEKGLEKAIKNVFPYAEHRVCFRHLWKNIKKFHRCPDSSVIQSTVWKAANALTTQEFDGLMLKLLSMCPPLHSYLLNLSYKWSKCMFLDAIKNHYNTNNWSESFNSWIGEARGKPVVDLIDTIRGMLMEQRAEMSSSILSLIAGE